jgi:hypothetical protein
MTAIELEFICYCLGECAVRAAERGATAEEEYLFELIEKLRLHFAKK